MTSLLLAIAVFIVAALTLWRSFEQDRQVSESERQLDELERQLDELEKRASRL